jgi:hypothetical protein
MLGEVFSTFVTTYDAYKAAVEDLDSWRESAAAGLLGGDELEQWRSSTARHAVEPIPSDVAAVFETILAVSIDSFVNGYREQASARLDDYGELIALTPDLRGQVAEVNTLRGPRKHSRQWRNS